MQRLYLLLFLLSSRGSHGVPRCAAGPPGDGYRQLPRKPGGEHGAHAPRPGHRAPDVSEPLPSGLAGLQAARFFKPGPLSEESLGLLGEAEGGSR